MIGSVDDLFASGQSVEVRVRVRDSWQVTALDGCIDLHREFTTHPRLTALLTDATPSRLLVATDDLVATAVTAGLAEDDAVEACRTLTIFTLHNALAVVRAHGGLAREAHADNGPAVIVGWKFVETIRIVIDGVRARHIARNGTAEVDRARREYEGVKRVS
jgi:hypothetical protein